MESLVRAFNDNEISFRGGSEGYSSVKRMLNCFDFLYPVENRYIFYRLKHNCHKLGFFDRKDILIQPTQENMVCLAVIDDDEISSSNWLDEEEFTEHLEEDTLEILAQELLETYVSGKTYSEEDSRSEEDSSEDSSEDSNSEDQYVRSESDESSSN